MITLLLLLLYPPGWSDDWPLKIDTTGLQAVPDIAIDSTNASWIVWEDSVTFGTGVLFYSRRDEAGNILIPPTHLAYDNIKVCRPRVGIDSSHKVHFIWEDYGSSPGFSLWHVKLDLAGTILVPPHEAVSGYGGPPYLCCESNFVIDNKNRLHAVWDQKKPEDGECGIYYSQLDSLGDSIITIRTIPSDTWAIYPAIAIDSDYNLHITMRASFSPTKGSARESGIGYVKVNDQGQILIPLKRLTYFDACIYPEIVTDRTDHLHLMYTRCLPSKHSIFLMKLDKYGNILRDDTVYINPAWAAYPGDIAIDEKQRLHLVWMIRGSAVGEGRICYAMLDTAGNFLVDTMSIVFKPETLGAEYPRIAIDSANLARVCWNDFRGGGHDVYYKWQTEDPGVFEGPERPQNHLLFPSPASRLELKLAQKTKIEIFDVMGRRLLKTLAHPPLFTWTPNIPSGVYFIKLGHRTYPLVLIK